MLKPEDAANYLVTLYKRTDYQCEHRKLQKLLIFADILYYLESNHKHLINPESFLATKRGLSVEAILKGIYMLTINSYNKRGKIDESELLLPSTKISMNENYNYDPLAVSPQESEYLRTVFFEIGAYSGDDLTIISRCTSLWQNARKNDSNAEGVKITDNEYDLFLEDEKIEDRTIFFDYLKRLIK